MTAADRGNTGRGGALTSTMEVPLFVDSACDAPVIKPIQTVVATNEDYGVAVGFEVSDADHSNLKELHRLHKFREYNYTLPEVQVVLTAGNGTLTLDSSSKALTSSKARNRRSTTFRVLTARRRL